MNPLERVAGWAEPAPSGPDSGSVAAQSHLGNFDLVAFIHRHGLKVRRRGEWAGGEKWELECCPLNPEHIGGCAVITKAPNGALGFKCHHNSCSGAGWTELRERLEPSYRKSYQVGWAGRSGLDEWPAIVPFSTASVD